MKDRGAPKILTPDDGAEISLDERQEAILRSVIRQHIQTGEPIGSKTVANRPRFDLSPATIRNVMAELEERGLLVQPHTSAGRLPTAKAWRVYVDRMLRRRRVSAAQTQAIDQALFTRRGEIADLLSTASRQLSRFSNQVGVVLAPEISRIVVEHMEFVRLDRGRVVAVLVGRSGVVHNRILEIDEPLDQVELDQIGRYLSTEFAGKTLDEIRAIVAQRLSDERAAYDRLVARGLELGKRTLEVESAKAEVFVDGASNLVGAPEFAEPEKMKALMMALERKQALIDLLGRVVKSDGVQVVIGEEEGEPDLADCALVAANYGSDDRVMGTLGIVGPTRMEYAQAIALVDYLAHVLSRYLSSGGDLTFPPVEPRFNR
jgi:heat-inducible transcriptional repressor